MGKDWETRRQGDKENWYEPISPLSPHLPLAVSCHARMEHFQTQCGCASEPSVQSCSPDAVRPIRRRFD